MNNTYQIYLLLLASLVFGCQKRISIEPLEEPEPEAVWDGRYFYTFGTPETVGTSSQVLASGADFIDAPLSSWMSGNTRYWLHSDAWGDYHQKTSGSVDNPLATSVYNKHRSNLFVNNADINGKPWIMSIYQDSLGGLLAFLHMEFVSAGGSDNKGRISLAYSTDNGESFRYLGEIIAPYGDPDLTGGFIQGAPYIVKGGYFYCYYNELHTNVARAPVAEVIDAARTGNTSSWFKYHNGAFSEAGMFGNRSSIMAVHGGVVPGICHTQAAHSTYDGMYYLVMTSMNWSGMDTYVKLWQSADGINWRLYKVLANEAAGTYPANSGWQYASIVDAGGETNAMVGQQFYVICGNRPTEPAHMSLKRWTIDLADGPLGYWNLDNNALDWSGPNTGEPTNGSSYTGGRRNSALQMDGVDDYLQITNQGGSLSGMNELTVSFWVNMAAFPSQYVSLMGVEVGADAYRIVVNDQGKGHFVLATTNNAWYSAGTVATWDTTLTLSTWHHIVGTYDGEMVRLYIDGQLKATGGVPISGRIVDSDKPLRSGYPTATGFSYLNGKLDEIRLYGHAFDAAAVEELYAFESQ